MNSQQVRIIEVREQSVLIASDSAACGGCRSRNSCGTDSVREVAVPAELAQRLRGHSQATLEAQDGTLLRATTIAYLPPLAGFLLGLSLGGVGGDGPALLSACAGLLGGLLTTRHWARRQRKHLQLTLNLPGCDSQASPQR